jgi:hypothetical protein
MAARKLGDFTLGDRGTAMARRARSARRPDAQPPPIIGSPAGIRRRDPGPAWTHLPEGAVVSVPEHHHGFLLRGRSFLLLLPALPAGAAAGQGHEPLSSAPPGTRCAGPAAAEAVAGVFRLLLRVFRPWAAVVARRSVVVVEGSASAPR